MVLHELVTNAAKYGAISVKSRRVAVLWSLTPNRHAPSLLCIHWEESGGPQVAPATRSGLGTGMICELI
jgi:two-component sensor histidine kinase